MQNNLSRQLRRMILVVTPWLLLGPVLVGCSTEMTATAQQAAIAEACALYGNPINYSGSKDTAETVRQILVKNKTFVDAGCYKNVMAATHKVLGD